MTPQRIQLSRKKGWKMPPNTVKVDRTTRWGNPIRVGRFKGETAADVLREYKKWLARAPGVRSYEHVYGPPPTKAEIKAALAGKNLACWCRVGEPCHADVLLKIANR